MLRATSILLSLAAATSIAAQPVTAWMDEADIKQSFSGVEIDGVYVDGTKFTESYDGTGAIMYRDTRKAMTGRWSVVNNSFCTLYDGTVTGGCFKVVKVSANCFEFYFLAATEEETAATDPGRPRWTARGWNKKHPATCDEKPVV
jgi:hypothetical protein